MRGFKNGGGGSLSRSVKVFYSMSIHIKVGHHRSTNETFRCWTEDGPTLNHGVVARGPGPVFLRKTIAS